MKQKLFLAVLLAGVLSCSEDRFSNEITTTPTDPAGQMFLYAEKPGFTGASTDEPSLRTAIDPNTWKVSWTRDDALALYLSTKNKNTFGTKVNYNYASSEGVFYGAPLNSNTYYAFYPGTKVSKTTTAITFNLPVSQAQNGNDWNEHFAQYDFLYSDPYFFASPAATPSSNDGDWGTGGPPDQTEDPGASVRPNFAANTLQFKRGVAFFNIQLTAKEEVILYEVELDATDKNGGGDNDKVFPTQIIAEKEGNLTAGNLNIRYDGYAPVASLHVYDGATPGMKLQVNDKFNGLFVVGQVAAGKKFSVKFRTNRGVYHKTYTANSTTGIVPGKYYTLARDLNVSTHLDEAPHHEDLRYVDDRPILDFNKKTAYVYNAAELKWVSDYSNGSIPLIPNGPSRKFAGWTVVLANQNDIAVPNDWATILTFDGVFDGHEHTLTGLTKGLFGTLNGTAKNLNLENVNITAQAATAGVVANTNKGTIQDVTVISGTITSTFNTVGGIAGSNAGAITDCENGANVTTSGNNAGGIAGSNGANGLVTETTNTGDVTGNNTVGGIIGNNSATDAATCSIRTSNTSSGSLTANATKSVKKGKYTGNPVCDDNE